MAINFPNSPTTGQQYLGFVFDDTAWVSSPAASTAGLPAGSIMAWSTNTAPANWLICDGSAVSRTTYASLFSAIGTTFGAGNGSTTFNLPDLRGRVPVGRDAAQTEFDVLGESGGAKTVALATNNLPSQAILDANTANNDTSFALKFSTAAAYGAKSVSQLGQTPTAHNNLQPYEVVQFIIKTSNGDTAGDSQLTQRVSSLEQSPFGTMRQSVAQSIPNAAFTAMSWTNRTNVDTRLVTATNTGLQVTDAGIYSISATPIFDANPTGPRHSQITVNGTAVAQGASVAPQPNNPRLSCSAILRLNAGDIVNVNIYQGSGAALSTSIGEPSNTLTVARIASA